MVSNLYFNLKINTLSEELSTIKIELVELEVEYSNTHLMYIKSFSTSNMDIPVSYTHLTLPTKA